MLTKLTHILASVTLLGLLCGCAVYPAVQVAGAALTGYDAVMLADEALPRESVEGGEARITADRILERRLRERLVMNGQNSVSAHVIDSQAYLVGRVSDRASADKAVEVTSSVQGITVINCKFFPMPAPDRIKEDSRALEALMAQVKRMETLKSVTLHIDVISGNAILVGRAWTWDQKNDLLKVAKQTRGVRQIVDYIIVEQLPKTTTGTSG